MDKEKTFRKCEWIATKIKMEETTTNKKQSLLSIVAYGPSGDCNDRCRFCYTYHFNIYPGNEGVPFHWHRFLWSPIDGKGGYIWLQEMKGNVEKKRLELQQKLDDEKESLNNYKQYGPLERAITFFLFDRRDLKWREESLMFANRALREHDQLDIQRKEFIKNAERFLAYSEKVLKSRKIVSELFFLNNNLKRLPSDVLHHHVHPAVKKAMSVFTPDFGKNYVIPPMEKVHSDILKAFNSKVHYKLSPSVIASYANLLDNTLDVYGRPMT